MRGVAAGLTALAFALTLAVTIGAQDTGGNPKAAAVKNPVPANPASIKKGEQNYNKACEHCHGSKAQGDGQQLGRQGRFAGRGCPARQFGINEPERRTP